MILNLSTDHIISHCLSIVDKSKSSCRIDENTGPVVFKRVFRGTVVLWECVMEVVTSFSDGGDGGEHVLDWRHGVIVWLPSEIVSSTVDAPCGMKSEAVTEGGSGVKGDESGLSPEVDWNDGWKNEAGEDHKWEVVSSLESKNWIVQKIRHVEFSSLLLDLWMLTNQQPPHMSKEESTGGVMWVSIGISPLVMATMIASPFDDVILEGNVVEKHQEDSHWSCCLV